MFSDGGARYAYGEGTSFAAPIVSGLAALAWQAERRLASTQVADVMVRSANGGGWNEFTGAGVVDGKRRSTSRATYDVIAPRARGKTAGGKPGEGHRGAHGPHRGPATSWRARELRAAGLARRRAQLQRPASSAGDRSRTVRIRGRRRNVISARSATATSTAT